MKIILHFGMPGTGMSTIQNAYFHNLSDPDFHYLRVISSPSQNLALTALLSTQTRSANVQQSGIGTVSDPQDSRFVEECHVSLEQQLTLCVQENRTAIFSADKILDCSESELRRLHEIFSRFTTDIVAAGYISSPKVIMETQFQRFHMSRGHASFNLERYYPHFKKRLLKFYRVLGSKRVNIWNIDASYDQTGQVVSDFSGKLGISAYGQPSSIMTEGMSLPAVSLLYTCRKLAKLADGPGLSKKANLLLMRELDQLSGPRFRLHSSLLQDELQQHSADLEWIAHRCKIKPLEDINEDDDIAVRGEADLLRYDPGTIDWLHQKLGIADTLGHEPVSQYVACLVNDLAAKFLQLSEWGANNPSLQVVSLRPKKLSQFLRATNLSDLQAFTTDSLLYYGEPETQPEAYLSDIGDKPYILALTDAILIPKKDLARLPAKPDTDIFSQSHLGRHENLWRGTSNLLITADHSVIVDSFNRCETFPPAMQPCADGSWNFNMPAVKRVIQEPCYYLELVCKGFGHALVDTAARLWALQQQFGLQAQAFRFIGFSTGGLGYNPDEWPGWLRHLLKSCGIEADQLTIVEQPVRCRKLLVPKRFSPHRGPYGPEYNRFMRLLGDRLLADERKLSVYAKKIYLSRSQLGPGSNRYMGDQAEAQMEEILISNGFEVIHPQTLSLGQQVAAVRGATHIIGPWGSQMHLTAFCNQPQLKVLRFGYKFPNKSVDYEIGRQVGYEVVDFSFTPFNADTGHTGCPGRLMEEELILFRQFLEQHTT